LDRDGDGQVTLEDLEVAMRKRRLPKRYAQKSMKSSNLIDFIGDGLQSAVTYVYIGSRM
jgi:hypothetical protein